MQLIEFSFQDGSWELKNLEFDQASLIVGRNAAGKSRTLKQLSNFFRTIKQNISFLPTGRFVAKFSKGTEVMYQYSIDISGESGQNMRIGEEFWINNQLVLHRKPNDEVTMFNMLTNSFDIIYPPANKLAIHVNRDTRKYPYVEDIAKWAEQSFSFKFGSIVPGMHYVNMETDLRVLTDITLLYMTLNENDKKEVLSDLKEIGYYLEEVNRKEGSPFDFLQIKEKGIENLIEEDDISQGMLRSIYLVIFLSYVIHFAKATTIIIDDLCEGLDYERATKLGKLVYGKCKEYNIQLIATSNDMFLMDVVDIKYWNVLQRRDNIVTAVNAKNNPILFDNFKYTGLSNFDFFASDYIAQKLDR